MRHVSRSTTFILLLAALCLAGPAAAQTCLEPPPGMLAWWPADGDTQDAVGNLDAALTGGAGFATGLVGEAFEVDSANGGPDVSVVLPRFAADGLDDFTVELWMNSSDSEGALVSAANGNPAGDSEILIYQTATGLRSSLKQQRSAVQSVSVNDGSWHHVALVREAAFVHTYVDGVLRDSGLLPAGALDVGPRGFLLGQEQDCLGGCFDPGQELNGLFDEVTVYHRALSENEILDIVAAGAAGKCKSLEEEEQQGPDLSILQLQIDTLSDQLLELETRVDELKTPKRSGRKSHRRHKRRHSRHHDD